MLFVENMNKYMREVFVKYIQSIPETVLVDLVEPVLGGGEYVLHHDHPLLAQVQLRYITL